MTPKPDSWLHDAAMRRNWMRPLGRTKSVLLAVVAVTYLVRVLLYPPRTLASAFLATVVGLFLVAGIATAIADRRNRRAHPQRRACLQRAELTLALPRDKAREASLAAVLSIPDSVIVPEDSNAERLRARTTAGSRSFGEELSIELSSSDATTTVVRIESWSSHPGTIGDWGVNRRNVDRIAAALVPAEE